MIFNDEIANGIMILKEKFGEEKIKLETIHIILKEVIELVENYTSVSGNEKKETVIIIIKEISDDLIDDGKEKEILMEFIDKKVLNNTIDLIISASKGELNINKKETKEIIITYVKSIIPFLINLFHYLVKAFKDSGKQYELVAEEESDIEEDNKSKNKKENEDKDEDLIILENIDINEKKKLLDKKLD